MNTIEGTMERPIIAPATSANEPDAIKARQRATWASGDFGIIGTTLQIVGESLCEAVDLHAGSKVLDVAAGNGNCSLAAARRWCDVTSTDYVAAPLDDGRRRAEAERLSIRFQEADAEALPFADGAFDVVLSSFGVMFAPDHFRAASELLRVCRHNGRIGLANWTPRGFIGRLFTVVGRYAPPALMPPSRWGLEDHLDHLFRASTCDIHTTYRDFAFRYRSAEHWIDVFRT
jgi:ubiquinone/menaquinone biosynthesis C-methylase UbiE